MTDSPRRRTAVLGSPVAHSLSPVLHGAAYRELGLTGWRYDRIECDAEALPELVAGLGEEWAGLSVTMPGKRAALATAVEATDRATAVGAANTLVPLAGGGWRADCTDVEGITGALRVAAAYRPAVGDTALVLGAGGTASAAMVAIADLGITSVRLAVRAVARAGETLAAAERAGVSVETVGLSEPELAAVAKESAVLVSTVPAGAADSLAAVLAATPHVLDAVYHPWPTPLAEAVAAAGGRLATGLDMLLHQAFGQVVQFTGLPAPRVAMRDALREATGGEVPLLLD
ncbi:MULTISPECIES: shikimate dehydrogenase [Actinoalloteichus]|uniref:Shikimate-5-dehydrogenase, fungal AROM-type n=1 Tax=Actinoalloteichus fjordicus TaxID=1612552 RepID=A0AAC9LBC3_9PSEU|nr:MULTISPECIES: shikimate dehydrogenase [Actinoalloteichus]APU14472.1 shikimate-5-dehydrogenase, fungal AROM-type [Actinoalloteichus fjordicus]APU20441.1 shikimate-5-dehydrogenase, fungal AROM-type [Actinoalloteichus sp. GBA129-24]